MMKLFVKIIFTPALVLFALLLHGAESAQAKESLTIAAASSLRYVLPDIMRGFKSKRPGLQVRIIYGSSGKMRTQIANGAPFDVFLSANMAYPQALVDQMMTIGQVEVFALGRIAIWSQRRNVKGFDLKDLLSPPFKRIAIANPVHAPYGAAAKQALIAAGLWGPLHARFVYGENIGQTAHFASSGAVDAGIIALSLVVSPGMIGKGSYAVIPAALHKPINHGLVVIKHDIPNRVVKPFIDYLRSLKARDVLRRYGFEKPDGSHANRP